MRSNEPEIWPNFFIVGAAKAGTTSLYSYLKQHSEVYMSPMKEPHYFSGIGARYGNQNFVDVVSDREDYLALFEDAAGFRAVGEASTSYLGLEQTAVPIHEQVPDARIIILLRDPIERAYSHYLMDVRGGIQDLSFYEAVLREREDPSLGWGRSQHRYAFFYYPGVKRYLDVFGADQVLVLLTENLERDPQAAVTTVAEFLGLDTILVEEINFETAHNPYLAPRNSLVQAVMGSDRIRYVGKRLIPKPVLRRVRDNLFFKRQQKPSLDADTVSSLQPGFVEDIDNLERLLGQGLPELRRSWK